MIYFFHKIANNGDRRTRAAVGTAPCKYAPIVQPRGKNRSETRGQDVNIAQNEKVKLSENGIHRKRVHEYI
jgi:hypothetical protein